VDQESRNWKEFAQAFLAHLKARGILNHWPVGLFGDDLIAIGHDVVPVPKAENDNEEA
jgi:hypothetical protein